MRSQQVTTLPRLPSAAAGLFVKTEFQSWAWQRLFQQRAENQRTRSATMCGTACSFLGEECNAFQYDPAATHCRLGKVLCKITKDRKERSLTNVFISKTLSTCEASGTKYFVFHENKIPEVLVL